MKRLSLEEVASKGSFLHLNRLLMMLLYKQREFADKISSYCRGWKGMLVLFHLVLVAAEQTEKNNNFNVNLNTRMLVSDGTSLPRC